MLHAMWQNIDRMIFCHCSKPIEFFSVRLNAASVSPHPQNISLTASPLRTYWQRMFIEWQFIDVSHVLAIINNLPFNILKKTSKTRNKCLLFLIGASFSSWMLSEGVFWHVRFLYSFHSFSQFLYFGFEKNFAFSTIFPINLSALDNRQ